MSRILRLVVDPCRGRLTTSGGCQLDNPVASVEPTVEQRLARTAHNRATAVRKRRRRGILRLCSNDPALNEESAATIIDEIFRLGGSVPAPLHRPQSVTGPEDRWCIAYETFRFHRTLFREHGLVLEYGEFTSILRQISSGRAPLVSVLDVRGRGIYEVRLNRLPELSIFVSGNGKRHLYRVLPASAVPLPDDAQAIPVAWGLLGRTLFEKYGERLEVDQLAFLRSQVPTAPRVAKTRQGVVCRIQLDQAGSRTALMLVDKRGVIVKAKRDRVKAASAGTRSVPDGNGQGQAAAA